MRKGADYLLWGNLVFTVMTIASLFVGFLYSSVQAIDQQVFQLEFINAHGFPQADPSGLVATEQLYASWLRAFLVPMGLASVLFTYFIFRGQRLTRRGLEKLKGYGVNVAPGVLGSYAVLVGVVLYVVFAALEIALARGFTVYFPVENVLFVVGSTLIGCGYWRLGEFLNNAEVRTGGVAVVVGSLFFLAAYLFSEPQFFGGPLGWLALVVASLGFSKVVKGLK